MRGGVGGGSKTIRNCLEYVGKATKSIHRRLTVAAVSGHVHPISALYRCHSFNCDITGSANTLEKSKPVHIGQ